MEGRTNSSRRPARIAPSMTEVCTDRCTTAMPPRLRRARQATWLPCDAPLVRNHVRRAPHASAARANACCTAASNMACAVTERAPRPLRAASRAASPDPGGGRWSGGCSTVKNRTLPDCCRFGPKTGTPARFGCSIRITNSAAAGPSQWHETAADTQRFALLQPGQFLQQAAAE